MEKQRRDVAGRVKVWRRDSSLTAVTEGRPRTVRALESGDGPAPGWRTQRVECSRTEADGIWAHLVRARMHDLPAARPRRLALSPPYFVEFDVPDGGGGNRARTRASRCVPRSPPAGSGLTAHPSLTSTEPPWCPPLDASTRSRRADAERPH